MTEIELPALGKAAWLGVTIERADIAGTEAYAVTVREVFNRQPRRRWFPDHRLALLHAADQANAAGIPLFDSTIAGVAE